MDSTTGEVNPWDVRMLIYRSIIAHERLPSASETAAALGVRRHLILAAYCELHRKHALLLDGDGETIRRVGLQTPFWSLDEKE